MENDKKDKEGIKIDKASFISYKTNNISKDYTLGNTLGEGSFGTVRKAVHKATKQERAIKILKKSGQDEEKFFLEVNILSKLTHPNIIIKDIREVVSNIDENKDKKKKLSKKELEKNMDLIEQEMKEAAKNLDFERAMELRDILFEMKVK